MDEDPSDPRSHRVSLKVFIYIASVLVFVESESFQILQWMFCGKTWHLLLQRENLYLIELENSNFVQHLKLKPGVSGSGC